MEAKVGTSTEQWALASLFSDLVRLETELWDVVDRRLQLVVRRGIGLVGQGGAASSDFGDDVVGRLGPHERSRVLVP
ncbi:MAG: hypothetical protein RIE08_10425, partial [Acidimicrobiales bacterium]